MDWWPGIGHERVRIKTCTYKVIKEVLHSIDTR